MSGPSHGSRYDLHRGGIHPVRIQYYAHQRRTRQPHHTTTRIYIDFSQVRALWSQTLARAQRALPRPVDQSRSWSTFSRARSVTQTLSGRRWMIESILRSPALVVDDVHHRTVKPCISLWTACYSLGEARSIGCYLPPCITIYPARTRLLPSPRLFAPPLPLLPSTMARICTRLPVHQSPSHAEL
jgi:hypothetical protein